MNELNELIEKLISEKGGTKQQYLHLLGSISNHETGGTNSPTQKQVGGGPGRGKYQFEVGKNKGAITAARRLKNYMGRSNMSIPSWLNEATKGNDLDVSTLTSEQQDALFLGNMREHPKADFTKVWDGDQSVVDFWADNHFVGKNTNSKRQGIKRFNERYKEMDNQPLPVGPANEEVKDTRHTKLVGESLLSGEVNKFALGGELDPLKSKKPKEPTNIDTGKDFVKNWYAHPETRKRYRENMSSIDNSSSTDLSTDNKTFTNAFKNLNNTTAEVHDHAGNMHGSYQDKKIKFYGEPSEGTATHEYTHAAGDISNNLSKYLMNDYGPLKSIREKTGLNTDQSIRQEFKTNGDIDTNARIRHASYMGSNGELYPRIMEMRQVLDVVPGQIIDDDMVDVLMNDDKTKDIAKYYSKEKLKQMLNTVADNSTINNTNMAAMGGDLYASLYGDSFNHFGAGGTHEANPNGGVPVGRGSNGKINTVEQGESIFNGYVFSDRLKLN